MARYFIVVFLGLALCTSIAAADKETSKSEVCYCNLYLTMKIFRMQPFCTIESEEKLDSTLFDRRFCANTEFEI